MPQKIGDCLTDEGRRILDKKIRELGWEYKTQEEIAAEIEKRKPNSINKSAVQKILARTTCGKDFIKAFCEVVGFTEWNKYIEPDPKRNCRRDDRSPSDDVAISNRNNIPYSGVATFVGRDDALDTLHQALEADKNVAVSAVAGMGGIGKTELAIQYSIKYQDFYPGGVCWLFAREFDVSTQIVSFANSVLKLKIPDGLELADQISFCWRNWRFSGNVLVVFDDVTHFEKDVKPYLPPQTSKRFKVLMTTRLQLGAPFRTISLEVLTLEPSLELLESRIGSERIEQEIEIARILCEWLGFLPLGLDLVGQYLAQDPDLTLSELLFRLQEKAKKYDALKDESLVRPENDETWSLTAQRGVKLAFDLTWDVLNDKARHLGKRLGVAAVAPIPWDIMEKLAENYRNEYSDDYFALSDDDLKEARKELMKFHLLKRVSPKLYRVHALIREFFRGKLEKNL